jgi:hypothetical protein
LPMVPNIIPSQERPSTGPKAALASIHYMVAPAIDAKTSQRRGQIDVLAGPDKSLYYRVFGRDKDGRSELRVARSLSRGERIIAFGGNPNMPMTLSFELDDFIPSGSEKDIYVPAFVPQGEMDQQVAACLAEMTVGDETKQIWLSGNRVNKLEPPPRRLVAFGEKIYALAYDVDRKPLGFEIKLDDFDVGFEPGTQQATKFESKVRLTDKSENVRDEPHKIWMNHPMDHQGYTFYQMRYWPDRDLETGQTTGLFQSVFQVATNPGRPIIYGGCLLVVLGTFVQFYMRAGVFTDGGKKERERAAARVRAAETKGRDAGPDKIEDAELL